MKNPFSGLFRARDEPRNMISGAMQFAEGRATSGQMVTQRSSIQISAVYACVRLISETVASLPFHLYERDGKGHRKISDHGLDFILHSEANPEMTAFTLRETMMTHLLLWGNAYVQKVYNGAGRLLYLYPLLPEYMDVDRDEQGEIVYTYTEGGREIRMTRREVWHVPGLGFDGLVGYSPVAMMRNALGLSLAAEEYGAVFFKNNATPSGYLRHPGTFGRGPDGEAKVKRFRETWHNAYGGKNRGRVAILEDGMEYKSISVPNNEAQFLETRKFQVSEIARIYRVPPHMIGDLEKATFSNIEHQSIEFAMHTIRPWLVRIEQSANKELLASWEKDRYYSGFNMDGLMRGDYKSRMDGYAIARQNGWMNADDIREMEDMDPIPEGAGGDAYLVNGNMISLAAAAQNAPTNNNNADAAQGKDGDK